jgi:hypothetical protein
MRQRERRIGFLTSLRYHTNGSARSHNVVAYTIHRIRRETHTKDHGSQRVGLFFFSSRPADQGRASVGAAGLKIGKCMAEFCADESRGVWMLGVGRLSTCAKALLGLGVVRRVIPTPSSSSSMLESVTSILRAPRDTWLGVVSFVYCARSMHDGPPHRFAFHHILSLGPSADTHSARSSDLVLGIFLALLTCSQFFLMSDRCLLARCSSPWSLLLLLLGVSRRVLCAFSLGIFLCLP